MSQDLLNIRFYDGDRSGCKQVTSLSKSLVGYLIPRGKLTSMSGEQDLGRNGVYFLFGEDNTGERVVYIGKVEARQSGTGLKDRIEEHLREKDNAYWTEFAILTAVNDSIGASEASYLEGRFYELAKDANRCIVKNKNKPPKGTLTEFHQEECDKFLEDGIRYLSTFGCDVFSSPTTCKGDYSKGLVLEGKTKRCHVKMARSGGSFVLLKGSKISMKEVPTCPQSVKSQRKEQKNKFDKNGVLKADIPFTTPSAAASFATGSTQSWRTFFKDAKGNTLEEASQSQQPK